MSIEVRANYEKSLIEQRVNGENFENEPRTNHGDFTNELQENYWKSSFEPKASRETLTNEQLVICIQDGIDTAGNMLLLWQQCRNFITLIAKKYKGYAELDDLQQEGFISLCEAVRHYDAAAGCKFITYSAFWIKQGMQRYIDNTCSVVRIPVGTRGLTRQYKKLYEEYEKYYGTTPTDETMESLLGVGREKLTDIKESVAMGQIRSLSVPLGDEENDLTAEDTVASHEHLEDDAIKRLDTAAMKDELWAAVDTLKGQQSAIIRCRFQEDKTLKEIGDVVGLSADKARVECDKALRELRRPSRSQHYKKYYEDYLEGICYRHLGVGNFNRTWTSITELAAIGDCPVPPVAVP